MKCREANSDVLDDPHALSRKFQAVENQGRLSPRRATQHDDRLRQTPSQEDKVMTQRVSPKSQIGTQTSTATPTKYVYFFGGGKAEGNGRMKDVLGGKGAGLAEMTNAGLPVPPGFTIQTEACREYMLGTFSPEINTEMLAALARLEELQGQKLGAAENPLLVSVRSGAKFSMPGMMDTILNLGLNDDAAEGLKRRTSNGRFAFDSYRRFIQMFGNVVLEIPKEAFEHEFEAVKKARGAKLDTDLDEI